MLRRPDGAAWVHLDAAWAGPCRLSDKLAPLLAGVESCDSVGFSAHKWLYQPKGVGVVIEAQHLCMMCRGVEQQNAIMTTSSFTGAFRSNEKTRSEFLRLIA